MIPVIAMTTNMVFWNTNLASLSSLKFSFLCGFTVDDDDDDGYMSMLDDYSERISFIHSFFLLLVYILSIVVSILCSWTDQPSRIIIRITICEKKGIWSHIFAVTHTHLTWKQSEQPTTTMCVCVPHPFRYSRILVMKKKEKKILSFWKDDESY